MKHFAKLYTAGDGAQCLITLDGQNDDDLYKVTFRTDSNGIRFDTAMCFEDEGNAQIRFDEFNEENAFALRYKIIGQFLEDDAGNVPPRTCRKCGCTDMDCSGCIERTGEPCHWVEQDLCSACKP